LPAEKNKARQREKNQSIHFQVIMFDAITVLRKSGTAHRQCDTLFFTKLRK
jgi:hypothetical protein